MELTWYGRTCVRMRGKEAVVVADPFREIVGPTGRGITGDVVTVSHGEDAPRGKTGSIFAPESFTLPTSLEKAFVLDGPGEYEVRGVLIHGVRTFRDDSKGGDRGRGVAFVAELDGIHIVHLGDIGHLLNEEKLGQIGSVDVACVPIGGALSATKAAELVAKLDPKIVIPMPLVDDPAALSTFLHEMGVTAAPEPVSKLAVTISSLPEEVTTVLLESRSK
jgi:L-ascorbate metabolism protein UlaG (beta-lactamase superfamily)